LPTRGGEPTLGGAPLSTVTETPHPPIPDATAMTATPADPKPADKPEFDPPKIYSVAGKPVSILDLLRRFSEEKWQRNGISRLADLHLKVGVSARFRLDGELVPLQDAAPLTQEAVRGLVFPILRPDQIEKLQREYPQDVDAAFHLNEAGGMNFRINAFH